MKLFWWSQYKEMQQQAKMILRAGTHEDMEIENIIVDHYCKNITTSEAEKKIFDCLYEITEPENRSK